MYHPCNLWQPHNLEGEQGESRTTTALIIDIKVQNNVTMTGELNLRGQTTATGGLKEKIFGAMKAGEGKYSTRVWSRYKNGF